ncbi:MAG TPA: hypothetical protein VFE05_17800 [Longimicrobiaceae bacterium]|jgi:hypothetical protein|nr:hypothetical protein [Longimicrobiaceae bacterium]
MRLPKFGARRAGLLFLAAALAGCTDQQPAGPAASRRDTAPAEEWFRVGSFDLPATGGPGNYPLTSTGIQLRDGQRARISVSGEITLTYNDEYSYVCGIKATPPTPPITWPAFCGSGAPYDGQTAGPRGFSALDDAMWVQVWMQRPDGQMGRVGYYYEGAAFRPEITGPGTIYVSRNGFTGYFEYNGVYVWNTSGTNIVSVEVLKPVDAGCGGASLNRSAGGAHLDVAGGACPPPPPSDSLVVECTGDKGPNQVTRGQDLTCTARPVPAGAALEILGWSFQGGGGPEIKPEAGEEHAATWGGKMVVSGTISVSGTVDGHLHTAQASVTVTPRSGFRMHYPASPPESAWHWVGSFAPGDTILQYPVVIRNGKIEDGSFGKSEGAYPQRPFIDEGSGPNDGWLFAGEPPTFKGEMSIWLNRAMLHDDPYYRAQVGDTGVPGVSTSERKCGPAFMAEALRHTTAHELGHLEAWRKWYESDAAGDLVEGFTLYEGKQSSSVETLDGAFVRPLGAGANAARVQWDANNVLNVPCNLQPIFPK